MKDKTEKVIYVGKAKNLHSRVNSYFREGQTLTAAKKSMVSQIVDIEIILCQTEVEALTLETNLIKHLTPKYNILMKDDKNLSYIKITKNPIAEVIKTRQKLNDGAKYFGPFTQGANISASLKNLRRIFKIRDCKMKFADIHGKIEIMDKAGRGIPCMDYYIGICPAPCLLQSQNIENHKQNIKNLENFLGGNTGEVIAMLTEKMMNFAKKQEFEKAWKIKEEIEAIKTLSERQIVRDAIAGNHDICVIYEKFEQFFVGLTKIRDGKIIAVLRFVIESKDEDSDAILSSFLARQYVGETDDLPENIFLEKNLEDEFLQKFFKEQKIALVYPQIGVKKELLDFTKNQLREYAYKKELESLESKTLTRKNMENVLEKLNYSIPKKWPVTFECYDISHTHGQFTYASRVVIKNGKPDSSNYKKYKIKSLEKGEIDDFASHMEVMRRRTIEGLEQDNFPDLIIIDWWKWQLSSALKWICEGIFATISSLSDEEKMWEFGILQKFFDKNGWNTEQRKKFFDEYFSDVNEEKLPLLLKEGLGIQICSIAKREEEIFLPNEKNSILFEKWSGELMVLQKARDESHRFSITANRSARGKAMKKNILEELPTIGPTTRKKLLALAGNVDNLKDFEEEELLKIVNKRQLEVLKDHGII